MTPDELEELVETESESLLGYVARWDGLEDQLAEMRRLLDQHGPDLIPHLPWERPADLESAVVAAWIDVHLGQAQTDPGDDLLLAALADRIAGDARFGALGLRLFGERAKPLVLPLAQCLEPRDSRGKARTLGLTALYWGWQRWTLPQVMQRAYQGGLLLQEPQPDFHALANHEGADSSDPVLFLRALADAGVALIFDAEQGGGHDQLVHLFASISGSAFTPDEVTQSERRTGPMGQELRDVSFRWNGIPYRFEVAWQGDLVDAAALARALNQALASAGRSERWFQALDGERFCFFFADAATVATLSDDLLLFLDDGENLAADHPRLKAKLLEALSG